MCLLVNEQSSLHCQSGLQDILLTINTVLDECMRNYALGALAYHEILISSHRVCRP